VEKSFFWIRWVLIVPTYALAMKIGWLLPFVLTPFHIHWQNHVTEGMTLATGCSSFCSTWLTAMVAPRGKQLVGVIAALLSTMPGLFMMIMLPIIHRIYAGYGADINFGWELIGPSLGFFLGASLALICLFWFLSYHNAKKAEDVIADREIDASPSN
jgi:hypothetical protein